MEGFEGLKFVPPVIPEFTHWYIRLNTLSTDQLEFLVGHFKTDIRYKPTRYGQDIVMTSNEDSDTLWSNSTERLDMYGMFEFSFNDIFKEA